MQQRILSQKEIDELVEILNGVHAEGMRSLSQDEIDDLVKVLRGVQEGSDIDLSSLNDLGFGHGGILSQQEIDVLIERLRALQQLQTPE